MLLKLLSTLVIILGVFWFARRRRQASPSVNAGHLLRSYFTFGLVALGVSLTLAWFGWSWFDGNRLMHVTISSPELGEQISYQVKKRDISATQLITVDGQTIRLSNRERLTITRMDTL